MKYNTFRFYPSLLKTLHNSQDAIVLCFFLALSKKRAGDDGYFRCSEKMIEVVLNMNRCKQRRCITRLMDAGLITTRRAGMGKVRRWIKVDKTEIAKKMSGVG